jgi:hypothetical protein
MAKRAFFHNNPNSEISAIKSNGKTIEKVRKRKLLQL